MEGTYVILLTITMMMIYKHVLIGPQNNKYVEYMILLDILEEIINLKKISISKTFTDLAITFTDLPGKSFEDLKGKRMFQSHWWRR